MTGAAIIKAAVPLTFAVAAVILMVNGADSDGVRMALRATARIAWVLFIAAFVARPMAQLVPRPATQWLIRQRSLIGVCFGLCLLIHVALIVRLVVLAQPGWPTSIGDADIYIGIPGLVFVLAMVVTSHRHVRAAMRPAHWRLLHRVGLYLVWFIFLACLIDSMNRKAALHPAVQYLPFIAVTLAALGIRLWAMIAARRTLPKESRHA